MCYLSTTVFDCLPNPPLSILNMPAQKPPFTCVSSGSASPRLSRTWPLASLSGFSPAVPKAPKAVFAAFAANQGGAAQRPRLGAVPCSLQRQLRRGRLRLRARHGRSAPQIQEETHVEPCERHGPDRKTSFLYNNSTTGFSGSFLVFQCVAVGHLRCGGIR